MAGSWDAEGGSGAASGGGGLTDGLAEDAPVEEERIVGPTSVKAADDGTERRVLVIYTGGTIGMKPNKDGALEPVPEYLVQRMRDMYEFKEDHMPAVDVAELLPLVDSSDMGPHDWLRVAETVDRYYLDYDGFVVCMGTDTMAHCACGLSFILENLGKPVLITGAMVPLAELYNDARRNLVVSILLSASIEVPEVAIFMNDTLFRGNRTVKVDSSGLDAFISPNAPPLAKLGTKVVVNEDLFLPQPRGRLRVHPTLSPDIGVIKLVPGFSDDYIFSAVAAKSLRGLVLELYGSGNAAARKSRFLEAIDMAIQRGVVVVATSQCLKGSVSLTSYALGRRLAKAGVVTAGDMTTECAAIKLSHLLGRGFSVDTIRRLYIKPLRGELTPEVMSETTITTASKKPILPLAKAKARL